MSAGAMVELRDGEFLLRLHAERAALRGAMVELRDVRGDVPGGRARSVAVPLERVVIIVGELER